MMPPIFRCLKAFALAETTKNVILRRALLTFTVVGAGPTGGEMAGAIAERARHTLNGEFPLIALLFVRSFIDYNLYR